MATKPAPSRELAPQCRGCQRAHLPSDECKVILYPQAPWAKKPCWAYSQDPGWERAAHLATSRYMGELPSDGTRRRAT